MPTINKNLELVIPSLEVIEQILKTLKSFDDKFMLQTDKKFQEGLDSFNDLYVKMSDTLISDIELLRNPDDIVNYK